MKKSNLVMISIIIAVYNAEESLNITLKSLSLQEFKDFEVIIVDNNSTDNTSIIISKYSSLKIIYIREKDSGIYDAWNKGLKYSTGKWISFLGSGDYLLRDTLFKMTNLLNLNPNINFISGCVELFDEHKNIKIVGEQFCSKKILYYQNVAHIGALTSKKLIIDNGYFNSSYKISGDYDFFLRVRILIEPIFLNEVICTGSMGISQTNPLVIFENFRIWETLNIHNYLSRIYLLFKRLISFYLKHIYENISRYFIYK